MKFFLVMRQKPDISFRVMITSLVNFLFCGVFRFYKMGVIFTASLLVSGLFAANNLTVSGDLSLSEQHEELFEFVVNKSDGIGRIFFDFKKNPLNLDVYTHLLVDLKNQTEGDVDVFLYATSELKKNDRYTAGRFLIKPYELDEMRVLLLRNYFESEHPWVKAFGRIRGLPGGHFSNWRYLDTSKIRQVELTLKWTNAKTKAGKILIRSPQGDGHYRTNDLNPEDLPRPLLDEMGQLVVGSWEGRAEDVIELKEDGKRDYVLYKDHPVIDGFSEYGGWRAGPKYEATGHFYTKKINDKWWFVDPHGYLFWSLGVTGVGGGAVTMTDERNGFFPDTLNRQFVRRENFVSNQKSFTGYDFLSSNLFQKYGANWESLNQAVTLGRMRAWGLNTIGAWSVDSVLGQGKVPYTLIVHPKLQGLGSLDKIPDPFSVQFRKDLSEKVIELAKLYGGDPWNLGVFIDNELQWGKGSRLASEVIDLELSVPAKRAMVEFYRKRYASIDALNRAWGSSFDDFKAIRSLPHKRAKKVYYEDLNAYCDYHADTYFAFCAKLLKEHMPGHLYLGCRFHGSIYNGNNVIVQKAASRHVDVMSYNIYKTSIDQVQTHQEVDRPNLIGEFHFGTGSHGVWGYGLVACDTLEDQAELYKVYVKEALQHPDFIGAHWFKWSDHPVTGRYDGENYRIGFVNIVDRSYEPLTKAIHKTASDMYRARYVVE